jgi:uncharacterized protein YaaW (UPF0174 family)
MKKHFYTHLIDSEALLLELDGLEIEKDEKKELEEMIDANMHHAILEAVLDELSEEDKQIFLSHVSHNNHDKVWEHLRVRIENIEGKIKTTAETMMVDLYKDIKAVKEEEIESS